MKKERIYYEIIQKISSPNFFSFFNSNFASNFTTAYADGTTQVNITNVDIASLSNSEKELIISGKPTGVVNSTTSVKLVYKKVACPIDKPSLPNTGTSTGLVTLDAGILVLGAAYALLKSNKGKKLITILFVVGAGSILVGSVDASQVILNGETKVVSISQLEEITVDEIDCYEYVGYIIVKGDETTTVTTESGTTKVTTTETPTTETPTTEGPTTGETTTEETTEETTTDQTESEEEVTVKPGTPAPA